MYKLSFFAYIKNMKNKFIKYVYILLPVVLGGLIGFITKDYIDYQSLNRPPLSPPKILFPIAWTIIYLLMGFAYYNYKKEYNINNDSTTKIYYIQLIVNLLWSVIFFVFKLRFIAVLWIITLLVLIILLYCKFFEKTRLSSYLLIPYIIWTTFATYLTIGIYILN